MSFVGDMFGSDNEFHAEEQKIDKGAYNYDGEEGGADKASARYAQGAIDAQKRTAEQANYTNANIDRDQGQQSRTSQGDALSMLKSQADGTAPSVAKMSADNSMGKIAAEQSSAAASARGPAALALAQQTAAANTSAAQGNVANAAAVASAQERAEAQNSYLTGATTMRAGDNASRTQSAQQEQFQAQLREKQRAQNDAVTADMTKNEIGVQTAQLGAKQNEQAQGSANKNAAQGINAGVAAQNAGTAQQNGQAVIGMAASAAGGAASAVSDERIKDYTPMAPDAPSIEAPTIGNPVAGVAGAGTSFGNQVGGTVASMFAKGPPVDATTGSMVLGAGGGMDVGATIQKTSHDIPEWHRKHPGSPGGETMGSDERCKDYGLPFNAPKSALLAAMRGANEKSIEGIGGGPGDLVASMSGSGPQDMTNWDPLIQSARSKGAMSSAIQNAQLDADMNRSIGATGAVNKGSVAPISNLIAPMTAADKETVAVSKASKAHGIDQTDKQTDAASAAGRRVADDTKQEAAAAGAATPATAAVPDAKAKAPASVSGAVGGTLSSIGTSLMANAGRGGTYQPMGGYVPPSLIDTGATVRSDTRAKEKVADLAYSQGVQAGATGSPLMQLDDAPKTGAEKVVQKAADAYHDATKPATLAADTLRHGGYTAAIGATAANLAAAHPAPAPALAAAPSSTQNAGHPSEQIFRERDERNFRVMTRANELTAQTLAARTAPPTSDQSAAPSRSSYLAAVQQAMTGGQPAAQAGVVPSDERCKEIGLPVNAPTSALPEAMKSEREQILDRNEAATPTPAATVQPISDTQAAAGKAEMAQMLAATEAEHADYKAAMAANKVIAAEAPHAMSEREAILARNEAADPTPEAPAPVEAPKPAKVAEKAMSDREAILARNEAREMQAAMVAQREAPAAVVPQDPMASALRTLQPASYHYKPGTPGEDPRDVHVGPRSAQEMAANPVARTAIVSDPRSGMLGIDVKKGVKLGLAGVGYHQQQLDAMKAEQALREEEQDDFNSLVLASMQPRSEREQVLARNARKGR